VVLFFKVGKFYELYEDDAEVGCSELGWKMTVSGVGHCRQVGCPESGVDVAVAALVQRGYRVAGGSLRICTRPSVNLLFPLYAYV
jgi:DNA mismatch repair protein MSH6